MENKVDDNLISLIIPMLNELENVDSILSRLIDVLRDRRGKFEIIIADGGSIDGTQEKVEVWAKKEAVRLVRADSGHGLAGDVLVAAKHARGAVVAVMDADMSHPPETIPLLVKPILEGTYDVVIGSRYVAGGKTPDWPWMRRIISQFAALMVWVFSDVKDPTSGFFAVRRELLTQVSPDASGFKILLELLLGAKDNLRIMEIPICFRDRLKGRSKMSLKQVSSFLGRISALVGGAATIGNTMRFAAVGVLGVAVDIGVFHVLNRIGFELAIAHIFSFLTATLVNFIFNSKWSFRTTLNAGDHKSKYLSFLVVCLLALFFRGGVLATLVCAGWPLKLALVMAIFSAAIINYLGASFFVFSRPVANSGIRWRLAAVGLVGYAVLLRLIYLSLPNLIPEEAYYWNYAQHPALGYLDHPPMVAWMIALGTTIFGNNEFGVRIGAFVCWLITAGFCFAFARNLFGKEVALRTLILIALLPVFFLYGFVSTPDAFLIMYWAGSLFFIERALLGERRLAWWGFGICLGLGLISKYTIALLLLAVLTFILLDSQSRKWIKHPEFYAALLVLFFIFTPVLLWNADNNWASFAFQTTRRISEHAHFSLQHLIGSMLVLITPLGVFGIFKAFFSPGSWVKVLAFQAKEVWRRILFIYIFTLAPLSIFFFFSLRHQPKLSWTGPVWLAMIPVLAIGLYSEKLRKKIRLEPKLWTITFTALALVYGAGLHYLALGLPFIPYPKDFSVPIVWKEMAQKIEQIEDEIEAVTGKEPLVVGVDKYFIASELSFYRQYQMDAAEKVFKENITDTSSRNIFGDNGLMYNRWIASDKQRGKMLILVSLKSKDLSDEKISEWANDFSPIEEVRVLKNGVYAGVFFYRIVNNYLGQPRGVKQLKSNVFFTPR